MNEPNRPKGSRGRSVWAVVAGFLIIVFLSSLVDAIMHLTKSFPADARGNKSINTTNFKQVEKP